MLYLPEKCLREKEDCQPLSQIESTDHQSFVCCGYSDKNSRTLEQDRFRLCWKNNYIDEIGDYNEIDLTDTVSVIIQALSIDLHIKDNQLP